MSSRDLKRLQTEFSTFLLVQKRTFYPKTEHKHCWKGIGKHKLCSKIITFSVSRSPGYLNTLLISSVVFVASTAIKGWQKFETIHLGRGAKSKLWSSTYHIGMNCPFETSICHIKERTLTFACQSLKRVTLKQFSKANKNNRRLLKWLIQEIQNCHW